MSVYTITEPHPTVAQSTWTHAGRGGAGNHFRAPPTTSPAGVPTPLQQTTSNSSVSSTRRFYSGRGGAGNAHSQIDRPVMDFADEFSRADKRDQNVQLGSGYHVGRGGAGNFSGSSSKKGRQGSTSSESSNSSSGSVKNSSSILARLGLRR